MQKFIWSFYLLLLSIEINGQYFFVKAGGGCCCGDWQELSFQNSDFEEPPNPPPNAFFTYFNGANFGGWTVTSGSIDLVGSAFAGLANGNPNGPSNFVDLHGSPGFGTIVNILTGLTPGNSYLIEFWYAQNGSGFSSIGTIRIAGGAWLNESWTVNFSGSDHWEKGSYMFMANATSATIEFSSVGPRDYQGVILDDIHLYECPADRMAPMILNVPSDQFVSCLNEVTDPTNVEVIDDCDKNINVKYTENKTQISPCEIHIKRKWEAKDKCGNISIKEQNIEVKDDEPPQIVIPANNQIIYCNNDILSEFYLWINQNAYAQASDNCGIEKWETDFIAEPKDKCDSTEVVFSVFDLCGNKAISKAYFIVIDNIPPLWSKQPKDLVLGCKNKDSTDIKNWIKNLGEGEVKDNCTSRLQYKSIISKDSLNKNIQHVEFIAIDSCGNYTAAQATIILQNNLDTIRNKKIDCSIISTIMDTMVLSAGGCDSIIIVEHIPGKRDFTFVIDSSCDKSRIIKDTLYFKNVNGCDSIVMKETKWISPSYVTDKIYDCNIVSATVDTTMINGRCDSFIIKQKLPAPRSKNIVQKETCDPNQNKMDSIVLTNQFGCDSILLIEYKFVPSIISQEIKYDCNISFSKADTIRFNTNFCDSFHIINYLPARKDSVHIIENTCDKSKAGNFKFYFLNQFGCDSILSKDVIWIAADTSYETIVSCNKKLLSDTSYFKNSNHCDSLHIRTIEYVQNDTNYVKKYTCDINQTIKDTIKLKGQYCDSIIILETFLNKSDTTILQTTICDSSKANQIVQHYTNASGCDSFVIIINNKINIEADLKALNEKCKNDNQGSIFVSNIKNGNGVYDILLNGQKINFNTKIENLLPGRYTVQIKDSTGCFSNLYDINLEPGTEVLVNAGQDQEIFLNQGTTLQGITNVPGVKVLWKPGDLVICDTCLLTSTKPLQESEELILEVIDSNGCIAIDSIKIFIKKTGNVYLPTAFSPNGDQLNDRIYFMGDNNISIEYWNIFNRWGEQVFNKQKIKTNNPEEGWDGNWRGDKALPGVYIYTAKLMFPSGETKIVSGEINLIR